MDPIRINKHVALGLTFAGVVPGLNVVTGLVRLIYSLALIAINSANRWWNTRSKKEMHGAVRPEEETQLRKDLVKAVNKAKEQAVISLGLMIPIVGNVYSIQAVIEYRRQ